MDEIISRNGEFTSQNLKLAELISSYCCFLDLWRLDSNIEWVMSNYSSLLLKKPCFFNAFTFFKITMNSFLLNQLCKTSLFTKREQWLIFSSLKKSCFLNSALLVNFQIEWSVYLCTYIKELKEILSIVRKGHKTKPE